MKTLYVIHHTHTDIGYTELQGRVARWQSDFVRQALDIMWGGGLADEASALSVCRDACLDIRCLRLEHEAGCR